MSHTLRVSDENFAWLQKFAEPLIDDDDSTLTKIRKMVEEPGVDRGGTVIPFQPRTPRGPTGSPNHRFGRDLMEVLRDKGPSGRHEILAELGTRLAGKLKASDWAREPSGAIAWYHRVDATKWYYKKNRLITEVRRGIWDLTDLGRKMLQDIP